MSEKRIQSMQVKKIYPAKFHRIQLFIFDINQSSFTVIVAVHIAVKALLALLLGSCPKSRLNRLSTSSPLMSRLLKPLNLFISSKSHMQDYAFILIIANQ